MAALDANREDQYDVVHVLHWKLEWSVQYGTEVSVARLHCGIRLVTSDTTRPVNCFNCLTGKRDWKYG